ncbi:MAG: transposase [Beijerinckiaceae bacterium]|nr:transposase [Beijerinckiaceae bacterium]
MSVRARPTPGLSIRSYRRGCQGAANDCPIRKVCENSRRPPVRRANDEPASSSDVDDAAAIPTDNTFIETVNGSFRDKCPSINWFETIAEAQQLVEALRIDYKKSCPDLALGNITPSEYAFLAVISTDPIGPNAVEN